jgi:hypothetical protein
MSTPKTGGGRPKSYKDAAGKKLPGVTTITGRFKESGGLLHWAWQQGIDGLDYRASRDAAADAGHAAHAAIDAVVHDQPEPVCPPEHAEAVASCVVAFKAWLGQNRCEIIETETPLISEAHRFGGTFDWLLRIDGKLWLGDLKTGNRIYSDMLAQMGAYSVLLRERGDEVAGVVLLRVGKEHGDFHAHTWPAPVLTMGEEMFLGMRRLYDLDSQLKKAVG